VSLSRQRHIKQLAESLSDNVDKARLRASQFFDRLRDFIENHASDQGDYDRSLRLTHSARTQPGWSRVEISWEDLNLALTSIADDLDKLFTGLEELAENNISGYD
jgi:hypothetical protein